MIIYGIAHVHGGNFQEVTDATLDEKERDKALEKMRQDADPDLAGLTGEALTDAYDYYLDNMVDDECHPVDIDVNARGSDISNNSTKGEHSMGECKIHGSRYMDTTWCCLACDHIEAKNAKQTVEFYREKGGLIDELLTAVQFHCDDKDWYILHGLKIVIKQLPSANYEVVVTHILPEKPDGEMQTSTG